jgi:hypothetical protein
LTKALLRESVYRRLKEPDYCKAGLYLDDTGNNPEISLKILHKLDKIQA